MTVSKNDCIFIFNKSGNGTNASKLQTVSTKKTNNDNTGNREIRSMANVEMKMLKLSKIAIKVSRLKNKLTKCTQSVNQAGALSWENIYLKPLMNAQRPLD